MNKEEGQGDTRSAAISSSIAAAASQGCGQPALSYLPRLDLGGSDAELPCGPGHTLLLCASLADLQGGCDALLCPQPGGSPWTPASRERQRDRKWGRAGAGLAWVRVKRDLPLRAARRLSPGSAFPSLASLISGPVSRGRPGPRGVGPCALLLIWCSRLFTLCGHGSQIEISQLTFIGSFENICPSQTLTRAQESGIMAPELPLFLGSLALILDPFPQSSCSGLCPPSSLL